MKAEILKTAKISTDQSVVCILGKEEIPGWLSLTEQETKFAQRRLKSGEESILINSYNKVHIPDSA